jgi:hypothetical protein
MTNSLPRVPPLTGKCPASPALMAGSLPAGRQEGAQYKIRLPFREAPPFRAGSFTIVTGMSRVLRWIKTFFLHGPLSTSELDFFALLLHEFRIEAKALQFFHENVEGFRQSWFEGVLTLHNGLVDPRSACHIVRLHREKLLE